MPLTPAADVWAPIRPDDTSTVEDVAVQITWDAGEEIYAPEWSGLVETVDVAVGQTLTSGRTVAIVGGIRRIAVHSDRPFARELQSGDRGEDVSQLNSFLASRGLSHASGDRFDWATQRGVSALADSLGVPTAQRGTRFEPDWFMYLPAAKVIVAEVAMRVGAPSPAAGEVIIKGEQRITSARLTKPAADGAGPADGLSSTSAPEDSAGQVESLAADEGETLAVGGRGLKLTKSRDSVDANSLAALRALVEPSSATVPGVLKRPPLPGQWSVPSAAVLAGTHGRLCVVVEGKSRPVVKEVAVAGQGVGVTVVSGCFDSHARVLVAPDAKKYSCS